MGVHLLGGRSGNVVEGNYIGTNAVGNSALANQEGRAGGRQREHGRGTSAGAGNLISGNSDVGVGIDLATDDVVAGNRIGTDAAGAARQPGPQVAIRTSGCHRAGRIKHPCCAASSRWEGER